jgi:hypothetical protein
VDARVGDRLVIEGYRQGEHERDAEVLEVLGPAGGPPYRVRWQDDGHESLIFPGSDAWVDHIAGVARPMGTPRRRPRPTAEADEDEASIESFPASDPPELGGPGL